MWGCGWHTEREGLRVPSKGQLPIGYNVNLNTCLWFDKHFTFATLKLRLASDDTYSKHTERGAQRVPSKGQLPIGYSYTLSRGAVSQAKQCNTVHNSWIDRGACAQHSLAFLSRLKFNMHLLCKAVPSKTMKFPDQFQISKVRAAAECCLPFFCDSILLIQKCSVYSLSWILAMHCSSN